MKFPDFDSKKEMFKFLVKNKNKIIASKKAQMKCADAFSFGIFPVNKSGETLKANTPVKEDVDTLTAKVVINTTNVMDSHDDVHIKGLWKKSLSENKDIFHDQEHKHSFDSTISDYEDLKAYVQDFTFKELGQNYEGETQALIFDSTLRKERNKFMFEQYKQGRVRNHSVGMRYIKIDLAVNDKDYKEEFKTWNKYIDTIANKEDVEMQGYFFAVLEAKAIEGSAVKIGSNTITPTLENNKFEPLEDTQKTIQEPLKDTLKASELKEIISNNLKNF